MTKFKQQKGFYVNGIRIHEITICSEAKYVGLARSRLIEYKSGEREHAFNDYIFETKADALEFIVDKMMNGVIETTTNIGSAEQSTLMRKCYWMGFIGGVVAVLLYIIATIIWSS